MNEFAGLDGHKASVFACVKDEFSGKVLREQNYPTHAIGMEKLYQTVRNAKCVIEASTACYLIYDYLKDRGVDIIVAHPKRVKAISSAKLKTDKVDARILADLRRANLVPEAHIPSKDVRDKRDVVRQHISLTQQHTRLVNQTKAALSRYGLKLPKNIFTKKALKIADATQMPESLRLKLSHARQQHELLKKELNETDSRIKKLAEESRDAVLLSSIRGVGSFLSLGIVLQIDGVKRFPTPEHLISYAGLCPCVKQSGDSYWAGKISHDACSTLSWMFIQAAWSVVFFQPYFKEMYSKLCKKKKPQKAIVIVAKRLARAIYFMLRDQTTFHPNGGGC